MRAAIAVVFLGSMAFLPGCVTLASTSSGLIGCTADRIQISNHSTNLMTDSWVATCDGKRFICHQPYKAGASCTPER
jgi:hypothetical protein